MTRVSVLAAVGTLLRLGSERVPVVVLGSRCLLGRHPGCDLRVEDPRVSGEHASVRWVGGAWELRDLSSRNGTFVGGKRLGPGERVVLRKGATFTLGGPDQGFALVDASPPVASARHAKSGAVRAAADGMIVLPDDEQPKVSLFEGRDGRWLLESDDEARTVADHEVIVVGGEGWMLDLPSAEGLTLDAAASGPALETIALRFGVSRDEEHVEVAVLYAGRETRLSPRSHHYLLLTLARARLEDRGAPASEQGWLDKEELCRMLAVDLNRLNVDVFRARKQLGTLGIHGIAGVIARRPGTGQLRLGTDRVEVRRL